MTPSEVQQNHPRREFWSWAVLFMGLFVYVWQEVRPQWLYSGFGVFTAYPIFSWEGSFLRDALSTPGGPLNALAALLAQTYRLGWLGALTVVAVLGFLFAGIRRLLEGGVLRDVAWVPVIAASMIYSRYADPLAMLLGIALSVWMAVLCGALPAKKRVTRVAIFLAVFVLAYWLGGASAFVLGAAVFLIEALRRRAIVVAIGEAVLACAVASILGRFVFGLEPRAIATIGTLWDSARNSDFSVFSSLLAIVLYACVPGLILAEFLTSFFLRRVAASTVHELGARRKGARQRKDSTQAAPSKWHDWRLRLAVRVVVLVGATVLCLAFARNHIRDERALNYYAQQRDWDRVISLAHRMRSKHAFTRSGVFDINRALAHEGRLGDELCAYPQDGTKTLFLGFDDMAGRFQHTKLLELYLDLGCPNAAEKNAYELLDNEGSSPYVLEALVRIHLVKGERESARVVFGAMKKYAGAGPYVRRWQAVIADPAKAESDPLIHAWRRVRGTRDYAIAGISFEPLLKTLLQETPDHRLAFEYLMAHLLLTHQRPELVSGLPLLGPLGYKRLPRHYAEAVLVHSLETRTPPDARGWTIEPDVYNQFREITAIVQGAHGDNQAAFDALAPRYGDTYTFFSMFNTCGAK